jgi:haloacetate dehalogenase
MFEGFRTVDVTVEDISIHAVMAGEGAPVLLLHGYPQTHVMWHLLAPALAKRHTVVAADLRGYGDSGRPSTGPDHAAYSKRAMAADQVGLMQTLGFERFALVGHDRGARVAHRMCLDHPEVISRVALLDIVPTRHVFTHVDRQLAQAYYHWFFLAQPDGLPEHLIGGDPSFFLRRKLAHWSADHSVDVFAAEAVEEYLRCFCDPESIHASCEDYRAGASIDLEHDEVDARNGTYIQCPALALWGSRGFVGRHYDVLAVWREYADDVRGTAIDCGHFLAEEAPEPTLTALTDFLAD